MREILSFVGSGKMQLTSTLLGCLSESSSSRGFWNRSYGPHYLCRTLEQVSCGGHYGTGGLKTLVTRCGCTSGSGTLATLTLEWQCQRWYSKEVSAKNLLKCWSWIAGMQMAMMVIPYWSQMLSCQIHLLSVTSQPPLGHVLNCW